MHGTGGREVVVFDWFQRYVEIVRKLMKKCYNSFIFNLLTWKAQVRCKVIQTTLQYQIIYYGFWPKMGQNPNHSIVLANIWWRHCDVVFSGIRLYVKSQDPFKMSFKLKLCSFVSDPSLFKKEINDFDSFGIDWLAVTVLSVDIIYRNTLMILTERNFTLVLWIL